MEKCNLQKLPEEKKERCEMTKEQRNILAVLIEFAEENWIEFSIRYEERTGKVEVDDKTWKTLFTLIS